MDANRRRKRRALRLESLEKRSLLAAAAFSVELYADIDGSVGPAIEAGEIEAGETFHAAIQAREFLPTQAGLSGIALDLDWDPAALALADAFDPAQVISDDLPLYRGGELDAAAGEIEDLRALAAPGFGAGRAIGNLAPETFAVLRFVALEPVEDTRLELSQGASGITTVATANFAAEQLDFQPLEIDIVAPPADDHDQQPAEVETDDSEPVETVPDESDPVETEPVGETEPVVEAPTPDDSDHPQPGDPAGGEESAEVPVVETPLEPASAEAPHVDEPTVADAHDAVFCIGVDPDVLSPPVVDQVFESIGPLAPDDTQTDPATPPTTSEATEAEAPSHDPAEASVEVETEALQAAELAAHFAAHLDFLAMAFASLQHVIGPLHQEYFRSLLDHLAQQRAHYEAWLAAAVAGSSDADETTP